MEKAKDEVYGLDRKYFEAIIEVVAAAMERVSFIKALAYADLEKMKIKNIDYMRITTKGVWKLYPQIMKSHYVFMLTLIL